MASPRQRKNRIEAISNLAGSPPKLSAIEDLKICASAALSGTQRDNLKCQLRRKNLDIFAPTQQVRKTLRSLGLSITYRSKMVMGSVVLVAENIKTILEMRLTKLFSNRLLQLPDTLFLGLALDKGASTTKICIFIGHSHNPNSPGNATIVGLFKGDDNAENLRRCFAALFDEIFQIKTVSINEATRDVSWFLIADLKAISAMIGHIGQAATYCCPFCEVSKSDLKKCEKGKARTLESIKELAAQRSESTATPAVLNQKFLGIGRPPIADIQISQILPAPLHLMLGLINFGSKSRSFL